MTEVADIVIMGGLTVAFLALVFVPLERAFPRREQPIFRREWLTDLAFFSFQQLLWRGLTLWVLIGLSEHVETIAPAGFRETVGSWPLWLQAVAAVLLCDLTIYWGHRLSHQIPFLWRFHRVHHTADRLDWLAAYREHPLDGLFTVTLENLPALLLGFPLEVIAGFVVFRGLWAVFIHSNVRLPLGPLKVLLGSPDLHHWHHDTEMGKTKNFANLSPLMDVIFGTYYDPKDGSEPTLGTREQVPRSYVGQLVHPLVETGAAALKPLRRLTREESSTLTPRPDV